MFNRSHVCRLLWSGCAITIFSILGSVAGFAQPTRIAVGAASISSLPTWVAQDSGFFAREGVPAELIYIRGGPQTMSALVSGEVPFAQIYGGAVIAAALTGADVVIVAGLVNSPFFSIVTTKGIDKPEDLRGKKIGITTFGSATDFALRLALKKWNIKADSENAPGNGGGRASWRRDVAADQHDRHPRRLQRAGVLAADRGFLSAHELGDQQEIFRAQSAHGTESDARLPLRHRAN